MPNIFKSQKRQILAEMKNKLFMDSIGDWLKFLPAFITFFVPTNIFADYN